MGHGNTIKKVLIVGGFCLFLVNTVNAESFISMATQAHIENAHIAELGAKQRIFVNWTTKETKRIYLDLKYYNFLLGTIKHLTTLAADTIPLEE